MLQTDKINKNILIVILIAGLLRICFISTNPNGFYQDEAINGYDAYAILKNLRDQYGEFMPLFVKSFNDYRESLHIFLLVPFISFLGLNELAVRLPSALIGIGTVLALYFLVKELFTKKVAILSAFFLAMSPWHIQFSRIGFGAIITPLFFCLGLLFFLRSLRQSKNLYLTAIMMAIAMWTYASARVFIPLFVLVMVYIFRIKIWKIRKELLIACPIFLCSFILLFSFWISPEGMARASSVGIIIDPVQLIFNYL